MSEPKPSPCADCLDKPCENNPYNEDQECWQPNPIAKLITLGGEKMSELVTKLVEKNGNIQ